jgi:predicted esterase
LGRVLASRFKIACLNSELLLLVHLLSFQMAWSEPFVSSPGPKIERQTIKFQGRSRSFYVFTPEGLNQNASVPLVLLFHGSGHNGASLAEPWRELASREKFALLAPDSENSTEWSPENDPPELIRDMVMAVQRQTEIDPRRIYLFGHSAGAVYALYLSLFESNYFAAVAVHAGALIGNDQSVIQNAARKIPIAIWIGTKDQYFSLDVARTTRDELQREGFPVRLTEMPGVDHNYYVHSNKVNQQAWEFLKGQALPSLPTWNPFSANASQFRILGTGSSPRLLPRCEGAPPFAVPSSAGRCIKNGEEVCRKWNH